jgi:hypothetical protein
MASVVVDVLCEGETHRVELRDDATAEMLDHDSAMVEAFTAFNAKPPECLLVTRRWTHSPTATILDLVPLTEPTVVLLALDFFQHAAGHVLAENTALKELLRHLDDDVRESMVYKRVEDPLHDLAEALRMHYFSPGTLRGGFYNPLGRLQYMVRSLPHGAQTIGLSSTPVDIGSPVNAIVDMKSDLVKASLPIEVWHSERAWQRKHMLRVINALEEGKPWPALT